MGDVYLREVDKEIRYHMGRVDGHILNTIPDSRKKSQWSTSIQMRMLHNLDRQHWHHLKLSTQSMLIKN